MSVQELPFVSVQPDWNEVVKECGTGAQENQSFWLDCYLTGHETIHGRVDVTAANEKEVELQGEEGIEVKKLNSRSFKVNCDKLNVKDITVFSPKREFNVGKDVAVSCVDISPNGRLFVAGCGKEAVLISLESGEVQIKLKGHLSDVTTVQFFPSNLVILTGGADFQLKIWSALNGSNPVTLKGHTAAITDTAIVGKGRNILSCSRDGTVKLWNCGTSSTIATIADYQSPINKMLLIDLPEEYAPASLEELDPLEVETSNKLVIVALEDGCIHGMHLGTKQELFACPSSETPLTAIAYDFQSKLFATGSKSGVVKLYKNLQSLDKPIAQWKRKAFSVTSLAFKAGDDKDVTLYVSNADGSVYQTSPLTGSTKPDVAVFAEYSGSELETIYEMKTFSEPNNGQDSLASLKIVCAVRDGKLKFY